MNLSSFLDYALDQDSLAQVLGTSYADDEQIVCSTRLSTATKLCNLSSRCHQFTICWPNLDLAERQFSFLAATLGIFCDESNLMRTLKSDI